MKLTGAQILWESLVREGVDVVFEHTGGDTFDASLRALSIGGRLVTCGATSRPTTEIDIRVDVGKHFERLRTISVAVPLAELADWATANPEALADRVPPAPRAEATPPERISPSRKRTSRSEGRSEAASGLARPSTPPLLAG